MGVEVTVGYGSCPLYLFQLCLRCSPPSVSLLPFSLKQTLMGLDLSVSVFGKGFDYSVRCYKCLNTARQMLICDPFS